MIRFRYLQPVVSFRQAFRAKASFSIGFQLGNNTWRADAKDANVRGRHTCTRVIGHDASGERCRMGEMRQTRKGDYEDSQKADGHGTEKTISIGIKFAHSRSIDSVKIDALPGGRYMSEQQNVDLIKSSFEAFGRGDIETILSRCTDDCEFYCPGPDTIPYAGRKKGRAEIESYFAGLLGTQSNVNLEIEEMVAQGDTVVAIGSYTSTVNFTGKPVSSPVVLTFHLRDGKIARHMVIGDTAALASSYTGSAAAAS
jgi:uncharacterized protein